MTWNDAVGMLTIGARQGSYAGMSGQITMRVRRFNGECAQILYTGEETTVQL